MIYCLHGPQTVDLCICNSSWPMDRQATRQQQHLAFILEYKTDIRQVAGKENVVADALSQVVVFSLQTHLGINYKDLADAQQRDHETQQYRTSPWHPIGPRRKCNDHIVCYFHRAPEAKRPGGREFLMSSMDFAILRTTTAATLIAEKFVWNGLHQQVGKWAFEWIRSQSSKIQTHGRSP